MRAGVRACVCPSEGEVERAGSGVLGWAGGCYERCMPLFSFRRPFQPEKKSGSDQEMNHLETSLLCVRVPFGTFCRVWMIGCIHPTFGRAGDASPCSYAENPREGDSRTLYRRYFSCGQAVRRWLILEYNLADGRGRLIVPASIVVVVPGLAFSAWLGWGLTITANSLDDRLGRAGL